MIDNTKKQIIKTRLHNNFVLNKTDSIYDCVECLHGIQNQYNLYGMISLYNRITDFELDKLYSEPLIKSWGQRVTLHINTYDNLLLNRYLYSNGKNWIKRRITNLGEDLNTIMLNILSCKNKDIVTKKDIIESIGANGRELTTWGGTIAQASIYGLVYQSYKSVNSSQYLFTDLDYPVIEDRFNESIMKIIWKYIVAYGPVTFNDFMHWSGFNSKAKIRKYFNEVAGSCKTFIYNNKRYVYDEKLVGTESDIGLVFLGKFDPLLLAYDDKTWLIEEKYINQIWEKAGQVEGIVLKKYLLVGIWKCSRKNNIMSFVYKKVRDVKENYMREIEKYFIDLCFCFHFTYGGIIYQND